MCGRFALGDTDAIYSRFRVEVSDEIRKQIKPRYNIAPSQFVPIVYNKEEERTLDLMKWGLVPFWAKDPKIGNRMINARSESAPVKPSFREPFKSKRCLVPATGFYEWQKTNGSKTPHFIHLRNKEIFSFAGLYDVWKDPEGKPMKTFTILTTVPNNLLKNIHDRMPVVLERIEEEEWLDPHMSEKDLITKVLDPFPTARMLEHVVSQEVNSPQNDGENLTKPEMKLV